MSWGLLLTFTLVVGNDEHRTRTPPLRSEESGQRDYTRDDAEFADAQH